MKRNKQTIEEGEDVAEKEISKAVIARLPRYYRYLGELMEDGIRNKIAMMDDECQMKLQDTMQKIVNDNTGGMVCIII